MKSAVHNPATTLLMKGGLFTLTVLHLLNTDQQLIAQQLETIVNKSPNFFKNAPVVIDLEKVTENDNSIDFVWIKAELLKCGLVPVGIRYANAAQTQAAIAAGLAVISTAKPQTSREKAAKKSHSGKIVTQPIRSGQQVYAKEGDLVVLGSVSAGAEVLAEGNIHIYGTLRGRALAGVAGDLEARIFCHKLEPELISIAGVYKLNEDIQIPKHSDIGVQIYLENEKLIFSGL